MHHQQKNNKSYNENDEYFIRGLIMDIAMDDAELINKSKEASCVLTLALRKYLYKYLLSSFDKKGDIKNQEIQEIKGCDEKQEEEEKEMEEIEQP